MRLTLRDSELSHDNEIDYEQYGFKVMSVFKGERKTDFKAIYNTKTSNIVAFTRDSYKLLPNEVVLEVADGIAEEMGMKRFDLMTTAIKSWEKYPRSDSKYYRSKKAGRKVVQRVKGNEHVVLDSAGTSMYATYVSPKVDDKLDLGEEMMFGVTIRNSVDATMGLHVDAFSYRLICSNGAVIPEKLMSTRRRHTKNLEIGLSDLHEYIEKGLDCAMRVRENYARWMVEQVNSETIRKLAKGLPVKYLPDYIDVSSKKPEVTLPQTPTAWKVYNDLTEAIWHESIEMNRKLELFNVVHGSFGMV